MGRHKSLRSTHKRKIDHMGRSGSSELIRALCANRKSKTTWYGHKCKQSDTKVICEGYDAEGYTSMNVDSIRNALYARSIKSIPSLPTNFWIDLGCGSSALLTAMVLKQHGKCVSIECNKKSAANALRVLKDQTSHSDFCVLTGTSDDTHVVERLQSMVEKEQTIHVVHEIFGFFASSEGAPLALSKLRTSIPSTKWRFLPARAGTFFQPSCLTVASTEKIRTLYVSSKLVLCRRLDFDQVRLTDCARFFEWYDFNDTSFSMTQKGHHSFAVTRSGTFNSISCFLFIDFGTSVSRPLLCSGYPFGDERLNEVSHEMSLSSCSSSGSYATNWQNPVLLFPSPVSVSVGDVIEVTSEAYVSTLKPRYVFSASVKQGEKLVELGRVELEHGDLYPDWVEAE